MNDQLYMMWRTWGLPPGRSHLEEWGMGVGEETVSGQIGWDKKETDKMSEPI